MFDWDDEVLENIIWGEAGENKDHIVPYTDETHAEHSKKWDQEAAKLDLEHIDEKAQVDDSSQIFNNRPEDKDISTFVDYGWANVGSFDDLDRVLSNSDLALWSNPKDVIGCSEKSDFLSTNSPSLRLGALNSYREFIKDENQSNNSHGEKTYQFSQSASEISGRTPPLVYPIGGSNVAVPDEITIGKYAQTGRQRKSVSGHQMTYSQHINSSSKHPGEEHQQVPSGGSYLSNKTPDASMGPLSMTPQQKIEKLKRRQKMRAMLAIRKQQQQFRHKVLDSDTIPLMIDKSTLEDTILHQLENVIAKLDIEVRLCIRDSLFRLAQSSLERQYAGDTNSTNKSSRDERVVTEERLNSKKSLTRMPDTETKTNPIDRMVAHLLFHRPPESLESQSNAKLTCERTDTSMDFPLEFLNENHDDDQLSCLVGTENELKSSCMDGSENGSNNKTADGGVVELEASSQRTTLL